MNMEKELSDEYFIEAESVSRASYEKILNKEWLQMFPEAKDELCELRSNWIREEDRLSNILAKVMRSDSIEEHFSAVVLLQPKIKEAQSQIRRLSSLIAVAFPGYSKSPITDEDIQAAKEVPLHHILNCGERKYKLLCPLHNEKTPSFTIYRKSNTFHCFGCGAHGDAIELVQKLNNLSFVDAVKYLKTL